MTPVPFEFVDPVDRDVPADVFWIDVPTGIRSKEELMTRLALAGRFPAYFGANWDALLDCLRDFGWVSERKIVITHSDLPLCGHRSDCLLYVKSLHEAMIDWACTENRSGARRQTPDHELRVIFPPAAQRFITELLAP